jgi:hypothetical protein
MQFNGNDLRAVRLEDRKPPLDHLIDRSAIAHLLYSDTFDDGQRLLAECGGLDAMAKRRASIYCSGRSNRSVKVARGQPQSPLRLCSAASPDPDQYAAFLAHTVTTTQLFVSITFCFSALSVPSSSVCKSGTASASAARGREMVSTPTLDEPITSTKILCAVLMAPRWACRRESATSPAGYHQANRQ